MKSCLNFHFGNWFSPKIVPCDHDVVFTKFGCRQFCTRNSFNQNFATIIAAHRRDFHFGGTIEDHFLNCWSCSKPEEPNFTESTNFHKTLLLFGYRLNWKFAAIYNSTWKQRERGHSLGLLEELKFMHLSNQETHIKLKSKACEIDGY